MDNISTTDNSNTGEGDPSTLEGQFSQSEVAAMTGWIKQDLLSGKMNQAQADEVFNDLGVPPEQRALDKRSDDERQFDAAFPPAKPEEYRIQYDHLDPYRPVPPEVQAFDTAARGWLSESGIPREMGDSLVRSIDRAAKETGHMDEAGREHFANQQYTILTRTYGADLEPKLEQAARMIAEIEKKTPGLQALLRSGVGDDARVAGLLISQAERYWARRGR